MEAVTSPAITAGVIGAVAMALRQIRPHLLVACPGVHKPSPAAELAPLKGDQAIIEAESAEAALSACIEAAGAGQRTMVLATPQDLEAMAPALPRVAALRLPIVMPIVGCATRSSEPEGGCPSSLVPRDAGWVEIATETPQEAYDTTIQALRIAEHPEIRLPVILATDGYGEPSPQNVSPISDAALHVFVGKARPTTGERMSAARPSSYHLQSEALALVPPLLQAVGQEFGRRFGRHYALLDTTGMADAQVAVVAVGPTAELVRAGLRRRRGGLAIGLVRPRLLRPFPARELAEALRRVRAVAVLERGAAHGEPAAPLHAETRTALQAIGDDRVCTVAYTQDQAGPGPTPGHIESMLAGLAAMVQ